MKIVGTAKAVRIYIGDSDTWRGRPLHTAIVEMARKEGLAGATVIKGFEGFGAHSHLHTANILRLSEDLPVLVEIVDIEERIRAFLPQLDGMVNEGLITIEDVEVVKYVADPPDQTHRDG
ncbi:MAG: DUF190 domain-containing protein [Armatimonadetes bacterium]|nr:DUF190 domain-containing protein [Armatimonadota bacterium]